MRLLRTLFAPTPPNRRTRSGYEAPDATGEEVAIAVALIVGVAIITGAIGWWLVG